MAAPAKIVAIVLAVGLTPFPCFAGPVEWKPISPLPDPLGVAAPYAGVSGGALLVAGGANFPNGMPWEGGKKVWHDRVWILEKPDGPWREVGQLPRPLAYGVSVTHRDSVICAGGSDLTEHYAGVFRLRWKDGALAPEPLPPVPIPLAHAAGALMDDTLIVATGLESPGEQAVTSRAFALDLDASPPAWRELPRLPGVPRMLATASARDGAFYLFGGCAVTAKEGGKTSRVYLREAWRYRASDGWQRLADLPKPNAAAPSPAPISDGKFLVIGGDDGSRVGFTPIETHPGFVGTVLAYDPAQDRWSEAGATPAPRATVPSVAWGDAFVIPSGEVRPGVRSPEVWSAQLRDR